MSYLGEGSDFRQPNKPRPRKVGFSDVGNKGSYTPGADPTKGEISNYSPKDQKKILDFVGGKDNFQKQVSEIIQKYPRGTDIDKFLDRINLYNQGIMAGGTTSTDPITGIERLNLNKLGIKDPSGATILSLTKPELTAMPPTLGEFGQDIARGAGDMLGKVAEAAMSGKLGFTGAVKGAWDKVRDYLGGEPTTVEGTAFPQPSSDTKDLFSSIDTGIAASDPDNLLVQIAKANEGRFDDKSTFQEQLANATALNLNIPSPTDVAQTITDYYNAAAQGVDVNTPLGNVNVNPLAQKVFLDGGIGDVKVGGFIDPNTLDYNLGINTALPGDFKLSAGASSSDLPGVSLSNTYLPKIFGVDIPVISDVTPSLNMSGQGDLSLGVNTTIDPLKTIFPGSAMGTPINIGASVDSRGNITPSINLMVPFNTTDGLGYMFK